MSHHTHNHHSHQASGSALSFREKGEKLLQHWMHHNEEHARNYQKWASEFRAQQYCELADLLDHVVDLTQRINLSLHRAETMLVSEKDA